MKRISKAALSVFLIFALVFTLCGCSDTRKAEQTVIKMFDAFKSFDFDAAGEYVDMAAILSKSAGDTAQGNSEQFIRALFSKLDYDIKSSKQNEDGSVTVCTDITAVDMSLVFQEYFVRTLEYMYSDSFSEDTTEEEYKIKLEEMLVESAGKEEHTTVTNQVNIQVVEQNGSWRVVSDENFINFLFGDLKKAEQTISDALVTAE